MGRRSRKRAAEPGSRAERDAARHERARAEAAGKPAPARRRSPRPGIDNRPPAPWGDFPLAEVVVLLGILLMGWGLVSWKGGGGEIKFGAGIALASLGGLELSLREHLAGFRSHTTLLSGVAAFVTVTAIVLAAGTSPLWLLGGAALGAFGASFYGLRLLFKRRSGGLGFR